MPYMQPNKPISESGVLTGSAQRRGRKSVAPHGTSPRELLGEVVAQAIRDGLGVELVGIVVRVPVRDLLRRQETLCVRFNAHQPVGQLMSSRARVVWVMLSTGFMGVRCSHPRSRRQTSAGRACSWASPPHAAHPSPSCSGLVDVCVQLQKRKCEEDGWRGGGTWHEVAGGGGRVGACWCRVVETRGRIETHACCEGGLGCKCIDRQRCHKNEGHHNRAHQHAAPLRSWPHRAPHRHLHLIAPPKRNGKGKEKQI